MASVTATDNFKYLLATGAVNLSSASSRMLLLGAALPTTAQIQGVTYVSDLVALSAELTGASGYARQSLTSTTVTKDGTNHWALFDSADVAFGALGSGATMYGYAVFINTGVDSTSQVLFVGQPTGFPAATNGSTVTITTPSGLVEIV